MKKFTTVGRAIICVLLFMTTYPLPGRALDKAPEEWTRADSVVATIDGSPVLETDVLMEADLGLLESSLLGEDFNRLLEAYLNRLLILREVEEVGGFRLTAGQAEGAYQGYLQRYENRDDYESKLRMWGIDEKEVQERLSRALLASLYTESHIQFFINIFPSDIEKAYEENPERWDGASVYEVWETIKSELLQASYQNERSRWLDTLRDRYNLVVIRREGE